MASPITKSITQRNPSSDSTVSASISSLPPELIMRIFSFLTHSQRMNICTVNRSWRNLADDGAFKRLDLRCFRVACCERITNLITQTTFQRLPSLEQKRLYLGLAELLDLIQEPHFHHLRDQRICEAMTPNPKLDLEEEKRIIDRVRLDNRWYLACSLKRAESSKERAHYLTPYFSGSYVNFESQFFRTLLFHCNSPDERASICERWRTQIVEHKGKFDRDGTPCRLFFEMMEIVCSFGLFDEACVSLKKLDEYVEKIQGKFLSIFLFQRATALALIPNGYAQGCAAIEAVTKDLIERIESINFSAEEVCVKKIEVLVLTANAWFKIASLKNSTPHEIAECTRKAYCIVEAISVLFNSLVRINDKLVAIQYVAKINTLSSNSIIPFLHVLFSEIEPLLKHADISEDIGLFFAKEYEKNKDLESMKSCLSLSYKALQQFDAEGIVQVENKINSLIRLLAFPYFKRYETIRLGFQIIEKSVKKSKDIFSDSLQVNSSKRNEVFHSLLMQMRKLTPSLHILAEVENRIPFYEQRTLTLIELGKFED